MDEWCLLYSPKEEEKTQYGDGRGCSLLSAPFSSLIFKLQDHLILKLHLKIKLQYKKPLEKKNG